jgi:hypothetical protein
VRDHASHGQTLRSWCANCSRSCLAAQVGTGQSPFAGALLTGYGLQRQQNVAAVNEAQAQTHLLDLANALRIQNTQTSGSVAGAALSSGRGIGPALGAVNRAAGLGMDQGQIDTTAAQADLANRLNMVKTDAEAKNLGSEAGGGVADTSPLLASLGFGIDTHDCATRRPTEHHRCQRDNGSCQGAHQGAIEAAKIRGPSGSGKEGQVTLSGYDPQTRQQYQYKVPVGKAPAPVRNAIDKNSNNTATSINHTNAGSPLTSSGDAIANDPELPKQIAQIIRTHPGYTLVNQNGDPRDSVDADGNPVREFTLIDPQGNQSQPT